MHFLATLTPTKLFFYIVVGFSILWMLFSGVPAGSIVEEIEVIDSGTYSSRLYGREMVLNQSGYWAKVKLGNGEIVDLGSKNNEIQSGLATLNRRYSLLTFKYEYEYAE